MANGSLLECFHMLDARECRVLAGEYKQLAREPGLSKDRAAIMNNIARTLMGLATQLDILAAKIRDEAGVSP
jgi:hypothetical protein